MFYSPFKNIKSISELENLEYSDLTQLTMQDECYTIEYKSIFDKDFTEKKLPKTVCAFSNESGGWLFIGIDDNGNVKDIDLSKITTERINSIIASRVQPLPHVYISILENPGNVGFGVVAIYVSAGKHTPYISNGTIYVRFGNESRCAERSTIDILIKKGLDYSDLSLKCLNADENKFVFSNRQYGDNVCKEQMELNFRSCVDNCSRVALFIQNNGKHFDENIELTIKFHKDYYYNIVDNLCINPYIHYDKLFDEFVALSATSGIVEYLSTKLVTGPIPIFNGPTFEGADINSKKKYMNYIYEKAYNDFQLIKEGENVFIKILFKEINPQQKMFLPAMLLCCNGLNEIEYTITSKYSMTLISGKLSM